ncbi:hypothetical protein [Aureibacter tunicatorum]|uniref:Uncharacterized protein n=1 Tax=Aureibacter tunicatorum TaxID=866807 RepID=A0AAE3XPC1_9BACT|nr:hypothetical protein [Aureibacter tunicatorum]MDR6240170.1 hypothetical protein [Aureibacter tunicatorum]BDD05949.1 hypothetical protein AUTU_34320 [Aureibacter tunicatorum]
MLKALRHIHCSYILLPLCLFLLNSSVDIPMSKLQQEEALPHGRIDTLFELVMHLCDSDHFNDYFDPAEENSEEIPSDNTQLKKYWNTVFNSIATSESIAIETKKPKSFYISLYLSLNQEPDSPPPLS